jgi:FtsP/CotA-like multicopper oxidase with cupredoxin domain
VLPRPRPRCGADPRAHPGAGLERAGDIVSTLREVSSGRQTSSSPAPLLLLRRGEPVDIRVTNRLKEPTSIHWHGLELESYFDGVPGVGRMSSQVTPPILPGESFVAQMTPPRAGTFIYHTHWAHETQLPRGLYGPLLVVEPDESSMRRTEGPAGVRR